MTAPDVAALAAALFTADRPSDRWPTWEAYLASFGHDLTVDEAWRLRAEAIIAALAKQGWRIISAPAYPAPVTPETMAAQDAMEASLPDEDGLLQPVSAQAAPDTIPIERWLEELARDLAGPLGTDIRVERIRSALPAAFREYRNWGIAIGQEAIEARDHEWAAAIEQAAVRAALEGLRDDIDLLLASCTSTALDADRAKGLWQARDRVDARLAALDA